MQIACLLGLLRLDSIRLDCNDMIWIDSHVLKKSNVLQCVLRVHACMHVVVVVVVYSWKEWITLHFVLESQINTNFVKDEPKKEEEHTPRRKRDTLISYCLLQTRLLVLPCLGCWSIKQFDVHSYMDTHIDNELYACLLVCTGSGWYCN